jgi:hypothetical protein
MLGMIEGVAAEGVWAGTTGLWRKLWGRRIQIASPRPLETLVDSGKVGGSITYRVRGTLKHLPKDHAIWLLTQDENSDHVWPQGFEAVQFDPSSGEWFGRVIVGPQTKTTKIIAVVAPPTSRDFFIYFQRCGQKTNWAALNRVPPECWNRADVQAKVP